MYADLFNQFSRCTDSVIFVWIELPSRECMKAALKSELERSACPEHFKVWFLTRQDNGGCRFGLLHFFASRSIVQLAALWTTLSRQEAP